MFDLTGAHNVTLGKTIKVVDSLKLVSVAHKLNTMKAFPSGFDATVKHPSKITSLNEATDG